MDETTTYYVTVAVNGHVLPGRVKIVAASECSAAEKAEMRVTLKMRDAITVKAIKVWAE